MSYCAADDMGEACASCQRLRAELDALRERVRMAAREAAYECAVGASLYEGTGTSAGAAHVRVAVERALGEPQ